MSRKFEMKPENTAVFSSVGMVAAIASTSDIGDLRAEATPRYLRDDGGVGKIHRLNPLHRLQRGSLLLLAVWAFWGIGCKSVPWQLYRTISPYSRTQMPDPYSETLRVSGGAEFKIVRFYATPELACAVMRANSNNSYAEIYINPHKARLVSGKTGIPAMTGSAAAREPMFRRMVQDFFQIKDPESIPRWSKFYFPMGIIPGGKEKTGLICFELAESKSDPQRLVLGKKFRMQLTGVMVAKGPAELDWIYLAPMNPKK